MNLIQNSFIKLLLLFSFFICLCSCKSNHESAYLVAKEFCNCMVKNPQRDGKFIKSGFCDSAVFGKSRFLRILYSDDKTLYSQETLDSAKNFNNEVEKILDTTCFSKGYLESHKNY